MSKIITPEMFAEAGNDIDWFVKTYPKITRKWCEKMYGRWTQINEYNNFGDYLNDMAAKAGLLG